MAKNASRILTERFWVIKDQEKDLYYEAREGLDAARKFARDYPGWRLVGNERILKMEKIPAHAQPFMGITDFSDKIDYALFCALLIFLEDKEDQEPFLLSELIDMMEVQLKPVMEVDWTLFTMRRALVRVMQFAEKRGLLLLHEGNMDAVSQDIHQEVLYENTGLSRFFAVNYPYDTSSCRSWKDYEEENPTEADTDRGQLRTQRVYRTLISTPAMYWDQAEDPDSRYLKNQHQRIAKYLEENLEGRLDIHKNAAFLVFEEENTYGEIFPGTAMINDIALLVCAALREKQKTKENDLSSQDTLLLSKGEFEEIISSCSEKYHAGWSKEFREMDPEKLFGQITAFMESWMLLRREDDGYRIYPGAWKFAGKYPKDFDPEAVMEKQSAKKENTDRSEDQGVKQLSSAQDGAKARKKSRTAKKKSAKSDNEAEGSSDAQMSLFSFL